MALLVQHPSIAKASQQMKKDEMPLAGETDFLMNASYDPEQMTLTITFQKGGQYTENWFYPSRWDEFKQSPDKGKYYAEQIRGKGQSIRTIDKTTGPSKSKKTKK